MSTYKDKKDKEYWGYNQHDVNTHMLEGIKSLGQGIEALHKMVVTLTEMVLGIDDIEKILNEEE